MFLNGVGDGAFAQHDHSDRYELSVSNVEDDMDDVDDGTFSNTEITNQVNLQIQERLAEIGPNYGEPLLMNQSDNAIYD